MTAPMIKAEARKTIGKNKVAKERKKGSVPAVVYAKGKETQPIYLNSRELDKILNQYGSSIKMTLDLNGEKSYVIIKEIQRNTLKGGLLHIDLQTLDEKEKIKLSMPIYVINKEKVETSTQILQMQLSEVEIQTYPRYLPDRVEIDALKLKEKEVLTLADLNISQDNNIEILDDINSPVAIMVYASKQEEPSQQEEQ